MKHILFPTDFSENARNAFVYALEVAFLLKAKITTVHAYVAPERPLLAGQFKDKNDRKVHDVFSYYKIEVEKLRAVAEELNLGQVEMKHELIEGKVGEVIAKVAMEVAADLIVMGTKGSTNIKTALFGSTTTKMLKYAPCSVLIIPENARLNTIERVAYATDLKWFEEETVEQAYDFAKLFDARLACFHVGLDSDNLTKDILDNWAYQYKDNEAISFFYVNNMDTLLGIHQYTKINEIDVLCLLYHPKSFLERLLFVNNVEQVALGTTIPLLILK